MYFIHSWKSLLEGYCCGLAYTVYRGMTDFLNSRLQILWNSKQFLEDKEKILKKAENVPNFIFYMKNYFDSQIIGNVEIKLIQKTESWNASWHGY